MATIIGSTDNDTLTDSPVNDEIAALDGDDKITITNGRDAVIGGSGHDLLVVDWRAALGAIQAFTPPTDVGDSGFEGGMIEEGGRRVDYRSIDRFWFIAGAANDQMAGGSGADLFALHVGGDDTATGGAGNDYFYLGGALSTADRIDGGGGIDTLALLGNYELTLDSEMLIGIERLVLFGGAGAGGGPLTYDLIMTDATVAAGVGFQVIALSLTAGETLTFDGRAETDGSFFVRGGAGNDVILGGAGADQLAGNGGRDVLVGGSGDDVLIGGAGGDHMLGGRGADTFVLVSADQSSSLDFDTIQLFQPSIDRLDVTGSFAGWAPRLTSGTLSRANFDLDLAAAVDPLLGNGQAIVFIPDHGDFAGRMLVVFDADQSGTYGPLVDYVLEFSNPLQPLEQFVFFI